MGGACRSSKAPTSSYSTSSSGGMWYSPFKDCSLKIACLPEEGSLDPVDQDNDDMEDEEQFTLVGDFSA